VSSAPHEPAWPPPRPLARWQTWLVVMTLLVVPFFVPIPIGLRRNVLIATLGDRLHIVLPAGITLLLYWKGPLRGRLLAAAATAAAAGAAIELLQELVGRTALLHDWLLDLMGIGMVVGWVWFRGHGRRGGLVLVAVLVITALAQLWSLPLTMAAAADARARFPVIADFEGRLADRLWNGNHDAKLSVTADAAASGRAGLRIVAGPSSACPGANMRRFPHDWSAYRTLELAVRHATAGLDSVRFGIRLDDFQTLRDHDWIDQGYWATRRWQTVAIDFADRPTRWTGRPFDATDVDVLVVFLATPSDSVTLEIDDVRLR
jgi:VanZ family protein